MAKNRSGLDWIPLLLALLSGSDDAPEEANTPL